MVDHPLSLPRQRLEHIQPTIIAGRDELDQGVEKQERLVVRAALLGLSNGVSERPDGLVVPNLGGAREVGSSLTEPRRFEKRASCKAMQGPPPDLADSLIDRLLQQRMAEFVAQLSAVLRFRDELRADEWLENRRNAVRCQAGDGRENRCLDAAAEDRERLKHRDGGFVECAQPRLDALGKILRQPSQHRRRQICALVQKRFQQPEREQRVPA
jgi:hypothetical protein